MCCISLKSLLIFCLLSDVYGEKQHKECNVPDRGVQVISNGEAVPNRYYPWHVSINKKMSGRSSEYLCGGSIISNHFILTAAHCLYEHNQVIIDERLFIKAGSNLRERGHYYQIHKTIIHRDYNSENSRADIALLQTSNVIPFTRKVRPVCYTNIDFDYVNKDAWIPGWGLTENQTAGLSENLNHANMPGRTGDECDVQNSEFYEDYANDNNFCAGNINSTSICSGDSGGGLVLKRIDGWYIKGIASTAPIAGFGSPGYVCDLTKFVLFTDVVSYADWIDDNLSRKTRKSEDACNTYIKEGPVIREDQVLKGSSSLREVQSAKEFPSNCVLRYSKVPYYRCGGSLISNRWVITAGRCIELIPTHVLLGAYNLLDYNDTGKLIAIENTIKHPQYIAEKLNHNIGLVKLTEIVRFTAEIHPACLHMDNNAPAVGTELMYASFGKKTITTPMPNVSHQRNQKVYPTIDCYYTHFRNDKFEIIPNQLCIVGVTTSTCNGDAGGPLQLLINAEKRIFSVIGIVTAGEMYCGNDSVTLSMRVSYYLDWIEEHVWPE